jgi:hypothetical protein
MAYLVTTPPDQARGWRRLVLWLVKRRFGGAVPGLTQIIIRDLRIARPVIALYEHLNDPRCSPLSGLQREMIAVVVNGKIGGAP